MAEIDERIGRTEALIKAYENLDREVFFGDIPLSPEDLHIIKEVRRSLKVFCPKWYDPIAYNKQVVDPLISHLIAIGFRAASYNRFTYDVKVNGIDVHATYSERCVDNILKPLLKRLDEMQKEKGKRLLVMLAAPPGVGKSTLVSFLKDLASREPGIGSLQVIGMDGFHRRQEYLTTHSITIGGEDIGFDTNAPGDVKSKDSMRIAYEMGKAL